MYMLVEYKLDSQTESLYDNYTNILDSLVGRALAKGPAYMKALFYSFFVILKQHLSAMANYTAISC